MVERPSRPRKYIETTEPQFEGSHHRDARLRRVIDAAPCAEKMIARSVAANSPCGMRGLGLVAPRSIQNNSGSPNDLRAALRQADLMVDRASATHGGEEAR
jgi:hypothetical protein